MDEPRNKKSADRMFFISASAFLAYTILENLSFFLYSPPENALEEHFPQAPLLTGLVLVSLSTWGIVAYVNGCVRRYRTKA